MECITFDKIELSVDVEKRFCKIYESIISSYFLFNKELLSNTKKMLNAGEKRQKFEMDHLSYQLAFLLSFSVQDTCLSVQAFYQSLMDSAQIAEILSNNNRIKLFCLESESLPTVIGVCQVLDEMFEKFGCEWNFDFWEIRVSVIENRQDWGRLCGCIVETVNSYFKNIDLKLDFVDGSSSWTAQEIINKIKESDLVIIARFFEKYRDSTLDIAFLKVVFDIMKEKSIIFWFDYNAKKYYKALRKYISKKNSFSEVKSSKYWQASFEMLANDEYCLDLAINWDTDCKSVMFSTWINHGLQNKEYVKTEESIVSNQATCANKSERASGKRGKKKKIALPKGVTPMNSSQKSLPQSNILHLQSQHSSLVTDPPVPCVQTMDSFSLKNAKTAEITMSNPVTMPKKDSEKKIKIKEIDAQRGDTHATTPHVSPQQTTSLHIQSEHPTMVTRDSVAHRQAASLHFQSQPSSLFTVNLMPLVHLDSLNFQSQLSSLATATWMTYVHSASIPNQSQQPLLVTVPICIDSNFHLQNACRIPCTQRSITPFAATLPHLAPPQAFSFQSNPGEMTEKQTLSPNTSHKEVSQKRLLRKM